MVPIDMAIPTYTVVSRHSEDCQFAKKGRSYIKCGCKKHIAVYDPTGSLGKISKDGKPLLQFNLKTRTRDWQEAERIAQAYSNRHDPDKVRAAEAEAKLEALQNKQRAENNVATIEEAIAKFLSYEYTTPRRHSSSKRTGKAAQATMRGYQGLLGNVVLENGTPVVKRIGRLLAWRDSVVPRPVYISDLTPTLVDDFRASWNAPAKGIQSSAPYGDLMTWVSFKRLKTFFEYCKTRGKWISENPLDGIALPTTADGYRTAPFTNDQYSAILSAVESRYPAEIKNPEDQKQYNKAQRLRAFIELMRWGGLAVADTVQFRLSSMKDNGHVTFRRLKTGEEAEPTLPKRVVDLLREIVPIDADPDRPFYDKDILPESNRDRWSAWAKEIFAEAGIQTVTTAVRDREPHLHMMRDTFVVNQIRGTEEAGDRRSGQYRKSNR